MLDIKARAALLRLDAQKARETAAALLKQAEALEGWANTLEGDSDNG